MEFAIAHKEWTVEDWKRVIWTDETKINRFGSDRRKWAWKKPGESLSGRLVEGKLKFGGGSLMMWGCFCWHGVGYACKIDGKMDKELYCKILEDDLQKSIEYYGLDRTTSSSSKTMTPNTPLDLLNNGSKMMGLMFSYGHHNLLTSIQLSTYGKS